MQPVQIDLRNLSRAALEECRPNIGQCYYVAPCVIGALVPIDRRQELDEADLDGTDIGQLLSAGLVEIPDEQVEDAVALQAAFDGAPAIGVSPDWDKVELIAARYFAEQVSA